MNHPIAVVNTLSFAELLARSSRRTLFAIAFYQGLPVARRADQAALAALLTEQVPRRPWPAYLRTLRSPDGAGGWHRTAESAILRRGGDGSPLHAPARSRRHKPGWVFPRTKTPGPY